MTQYPMKAVAGKAAWRVVAGGQTIATISNRLTYQREAARLLAGAADMLDALKALLLSQDGSREPFDRPTLGEVVARARAAIAKAEGG